MIKNVVIFLAVVSVQLEIIYANQNANSQYYTAGAVEYKPERNVNDNLKAYIDFIDLAKTKNVDILVFPEATFNYHGFGSRQELAQHAIQVPDPQSKIAPYEHDNYSETLKALSRKCKENNMYVLVNLVEKVPCDASKSRNCRHSSQSRTDNLDLFNTNVVFDRQGRVISRYRKYNLFLEPFVETPATVELATFNTDFGVKFGHFICFDIMFKEPATNLLLQENVTNILYPSMWFSDLPFLTAEQFHQGWAYAYNVNLISAGASNPIAGSTGSGIYLGNREIPEIIMSAAATNKLLTAKVPKDTHSIPIQEKHRYDRNAVEMQSLRVLDVWTEQNVLKVEITEQNQSICAYDDICCNFKIKQKNREVPVGKIAYRYMLVANYTTRIFGDERESGELYCAILACTSSNPRSCGRRFKDNRNLFAAVEFESLSISAKVKFTNNNPSDILVMPNTLENTILPLDVNAYTFTSSNAYRESNEMFQDFTIASRTKLSNILTFGIYGRNFALDRVVSRKIRADYAQ